MRISLTFSFPIFSNLSMEIYIFSNLLSSISRTSTIPWIISLLFNLTLKFSNPIFFRNDIPKRIISASAKGELLPKISTSIWVNSLNLPLWTFSALHTFCTWYLLYGSIMLFIFCATALHIGIISSYLSITSLSPLSLNL